MVPASSTPSRRTVLRGVAGGALAALAGCSASETRDSDPPDGGTLLTDYAVATTRTAGERPPVVAPRESGGESGDTSTTADPVSLDTVGSESEAAAFELADGATNAAAVRRLLAETEYASESVLVYQTRAGECYRLAVSYVARDADGDPDVQFCRVVRDAHTACERDERERVAAFVRLPFPGDDYGGLSAGSGGRCDPVPERYRSENGSESA